MIVFNLVSVKTLMMLSWWQMYTPQVWSVHLPPSRLHCVLTSPASCTDRAIHAILLEQCGPQGLKYCSIVHKVRCYMYVLRSISPFSALIVVIVMNWLTLAQSTDSAQCAQGMCVLWNSRFMMHLFLTRKQLAKPSARCVYATCYTLSLSTIFMVWLLACWL